MVRWRVGCGIWMVFPGVGFVDEMAGGVLESDLGINDAVAVDISGPHPLDWNGRSVVLENKNGGF